MQGLKFLFAISVLVFAFTGIHAQRPGKVAKSRFQYSSPKVRGHKARIVCPTFDNSKYPFHGLGVKLGDPFAVTYKYYPDKRLSFALDFGKAASGLYNRYFRERFNAYLMKDTFPSNESSMAYISHRVKSDVIAEAKVLFHMDGKRISDGLQGYAGVGWEWKRTRLVYDYEYIPSGNQEPADPFGSFERSIVTMGPQVVLGIEYSYFSIPIAAFMEVEYFTDIQADPGRQRFEGGVGLRYIF